MKSIIRNMFAFMLLITMVLGANSAKAEYAEGTQYDEKDNEPGYEVGLAATIGESVYFLDGTGHRGPVSLEVVPSVGWKWFKFDLGLSTTLESIRIEGTNIGYWNFTFRPGARLTPPILPVYLRMAVPLQFQREEFDWGFMAGLGTDIRILPNIGIVLEVDTTVTKDLEWGGVGIPIEFRAGVNFAF